MATAYMSEIRLFPWNWAPKNWAQCNGQLLAIAQNQALFSLLGTTYGGNGVQNFALPDLRGRAIVGMGGGYAQGQQGGTENVTLLQTQIPQHNHMWAAATDSANSVPPGTTFLGTPHLQSGPTNTVAIYATTATAVTPLANTIGPAGGNQPHPNIQPTLVLSYCICLYGLFPSRN